VIFTLDEVYYDGDGDDTDDNVMHNIIGTLYSRLLYCAKLCHNFTKPHAIKTPFVRDAMT
jgi:hypothetical protein